MRLLVQRRIRTAMARAALSVMAAMFFGLALSFVLAGLLVWSSQWFGAVPTLLAAGTIAAALALLLWLIIVRNNRREKRIEHAILEESRERAAASGGGRDAVLVVIALLLRLALNHAKPTWTAGGDDQT